MGIELKISRQFINTIQKVSILDYMDQEYDSYWIYNKSSNWANTNCPMPRHDDSSPSFGVNTETNLFHCFGCGCKGDIIELVQNVEGLTFIEAIQKISNFAGLEIELTNLDIKNLINEINDNLKSRSISENDNIFPGRLNETNFLIALASRTKKYIRNNDFNPEVITLIDNIYKKIDSYTEEKNIKKIEYIWNNFSDIMKKKEI